MKDLGRLKYLLGIAVAYSKHGIFISQQKYVLDLLTEEGKLGCKPMETPIKQNHRLCKEGKCPSKLKQNQKPSKPPPLEPPVNKESYQKLVGKLIYLAHTEPDISYAVSQVSQFMHDLKESFIFMQFIEYSST